MKAQLSLPEPEKSLAKTRGNNCHFLVIIGGNNYPPLVETRKMVHHQVKTFQKAFV